MEETGGGVEEIANGVAGSCGDVVQVLGLVEAGTGRTRLTFTRRDLNTSRLSDGNLRCVRGIQDLGSAVERVVVELVSSSRNPVSPTLMLERYIFRMLIP